MSVEISVGPPVLTINKSSKFMVTDHNGEIHPLHAQGVFADDTRFVSSYRLFVNGKQWDRVSSAATSYDSAQLYLINPDLTGSDGVTAIPGGSLGLAISRSVMDEGIHEDFQIINYGALPIEVILEIEIKSDFSDLFEVKANSLRLREHMVTEWDERAEELSTTYKKQDYFRKFDYRTSGMPGASFANGRILVPIRLGHREVWHAHGLMLMFKDSAEARQRKAKPTDFRPNHAGKLHNKWLSTCTAVSTSDPQLNQSFRQSIDDLGALRLVERDLRPDVWVPAAGVPWFVALFGRDSLVASLQTMSIDARFAEGALRTLAKYQAQDRDDWRDAQPGKIMHEVRKGELAHFNKIPQTPYYGTWDATSLYLILLYQAWQWLADRDLINDLISTAEGCLEWIDKYGDLDGDGFQEYKTFSEKGYENMSWKDSGHSVVYPDGKPVKQPKALCELQGYVYAAKRGMARIFRTLDKHDKADELEEQAANLKQRFNKAFWLNEEGTFAFGLDPEKRLIKTVVSNPGHCLWTGIIDDDKAGQVVKRLLEPDMWSGWGIRTLSSDNPAYNPFYYQLGSVWPHDNSIIAAGMKNYGFFDQANQVAKGIFDAAQRFESHRLPEVFSGLQRRENSFPVQYRGANTPQAWAAGSIFFLISTMLGLEADAPNGRLLVNPALPDWAPSLEMKGLRIGPATLDLRFWREGSTSLFAVENCKGGHIDVIHVNDVGNEERWRLSA